MRWLTATLVLAAALPTAAEERSFFSVTTHRFERHFEDNHWALDTKAEYGNDERKFVLRFEGAKEDDHDTEGELQLLYSKPLSAYWDWQLGFEAALHDGSSDGGLVLGVEGEAPYRIHTDARLTVNEDGDVYLHAEMERDFLITQNLALEPRLGFKVGDDDENIAVELRLRYDITRKFGPYIGVSWERIFGETSTHDTTALAGVSFWF